MNMNRYKEVSKAHVFAHRAMLDNCVADRFYAAGPAQLGQLAEWELQNAVAAVTRELDRVCRSAP